MVKKKITITDVRSVLKMILDMRMSREDAASWALELREAADEKKLEYLPIESEEILWESILFLEGIDLQDEPDSYLHNEDDIQIFLRRLDKHL